MCLFYLYHNLKKYMISFIQISKNDSLKVFQLASEIWNNNYNDMISQEQIDYMLNTMYHPKRLQQDLDEGYKWEFIYHNNEEIGYLAYVIKNDNRVFLSKIYLKTIAQGKGLGKLALNRVKEYAKNNNCKAVYLTVNRGNKKGVRAYNKFGFKIIAEEDFDIGNGFIMDDYIFEYKI